MIVSRSRLSAVAKPRRPGKTGWPRDIRVRTVPRRVLVVGMGHAPSSPAGRCLAERPLRALAREGRSDELEKFSFSLHLLFFLWVFMRLPSAFGPRTSGAERGLAAAGARKPSWCWPSRSRPEAASRPPRVATPKPRARRVRRRRPPRTRPPATCSPRIMFPAHRRRRDRRVQTRAPSGRAVTGTGTVCATCGCRGTGKRPIQRTPGRDVERASARLDS